MTPAQLTGQVDDHIEVQATPSCGLHRDAVVAFNRLRSAAVADGIDLIPVSSFRSFDRQLAIWNAKYLGQRPLLDATGQLLDTHTLTPAQRIDAILTWSALPGASRHHWGTDIDLIDQASVPSGYRVQLTAGEYSGDGPFARVAAWLEVNALRFGFFRPYRGLLSGVQAEPWHFSFAPVADGARRLLTRRVLERALGAAELQGKSLVLERLDSLHQRYVEAIDWP